MTLSTPFQIPRKYVTRLMVDFPMEALRTLWIQIAAGDLTGPGLDEQVLQRLRITV